MSLAASIAFDIPGIYSEFVFVSKHITFAFMLTRDASFQL